MDDFRPATDADVPALVTLINLAFEVERDFVIGDRTDAAEVRELMARGPFLVDAELTGCVYVSVLDAPRGYFGLLSVDPSAQGRGLGRRLIAAAEAYARAAGCTVMDLKTVDLRVELQPFYQRLGYRLTGETRIPEAKTSRFTRPLKFLCMEKVL
jgi:GNAT superfamily N-acetyltransferase